MAVSGAALAPLMGRFTLPAAAAADGAHQRAPRRVGAQPAPPQLRRPPGDARHGRLGQAVGVRSSSGWREPGALYVLREAVGGLTLTKRRFIYLTDGGHWENLGLVELLRRRCTQILCFDASTDADGAATDIGRAIALARSELGAEIELDLSARRRTMTARKSRIVAGHSVSDGQEATIYFAVRCCGKALRRAAVREHEKASAPSHDESVPLRRGLRRYRALGWAVGGELEEKLNLPPPMYDEPRAEVSLSSRSVSLICRSVRLQQRRCDRPELSATFLTAGEPVLRDAARCGVHARVCSRARTRISSTAASASRRSSPRRCAAEQAVGRRARAGATDLEAT